MITDTMHRLDPSIAQLVVKTKDGRGERSMPYLSVNEECLQGLVRLRSLDALAASVLLVQQSEAIGSNDLRKLALGVYYGLQPKLAQLPILEPFYPSLFTLIDVRCKQWLFVDPARRLDVVIFWQGIKEHTWTDRAEQSLGTHPPPHPSELGFFGRHNEAGRGAHGDA